VDYILVPGDRSTVPCTCVESKEVDREYTVMYLFAHSLGEDKLNPSLRQ